MWASRSPVDASYPFTGRSGVVGPADRPVRLLAKPGNTRQGESMKVEKVTAVVRVVVGALAVAVVLAMAV
jgi:hypothetical protein